jgi:Tol biopolymer transport system component
MLKKCFIILITLTALAFTQPNSRTYIAGSVLDISMNPVFSPDGNKIAYTKTSFRGLWIFDRVTSSTRQITDEDAAGFSFKWSLDSKSILTRVAKYENLRRYNAVKIFDVETGEAKQLSDYKTMMPFLPLWAAGDSKIYLPVKGNDEVLLSGKEKNNRITSNLIVFEKHNKIIVKNISDNSEQSFEPINDEQYVNLSLSPGGAKIVFEVMGGNMFVMNIDGTNLIDLGKGNRPRWSFNSKKIIYMITEDNGHTYTSSDIYSINSDGTEKMNITNTNDFIEMNPCFSPDGKMIVFDVFNDGSIYLMNIE